MTICQEVSKGLEEEPQPGQFQHRRRSSFHEPPRRESQHYDAVGPTSRSHSHIAQLSQQQQPQYHHHQHSAASAGSDYVTASHHHHGATLVEYATAKPITQQSNESPVYSTALSRESRIQFSIPREQDTTTSKRSPRHSTAGEKQEGKAATDYSTTPQQVHIQTSHSSSCDSRPQHITVHPSSSSSPSVCPNHSTSCTSQRNLASQEGPYSTTPSGRGSEIPKITSTFRPDSSYKGDLCSRGANSKESTPIKAKVTFKGNFQDDSSPYGESPSTFRGTPPFKAETSTYRRDSTFKGDTFRSEPGQREPVATPMGRPRFPHDFVRQGSTVGRPPNRGVYIKSVFI